MENVFLANRLTPSLILIIFLLLPQLAFAANNNYSASFSPLETHKFWSSTPTGNYTFGFKNVNNQEGASAEYLLSIWHTNDSVNQTVIWWADFGASNPIVTEEAALNQSSSTGMLELYDSSSILQWSTGNSSATSIEFLDSGNLRLLDANKNNSISWESFQYLNNVLMLGNLSADIIQNKPYLLRSRSNQSSYAIGKYHMATDERFAINLYGIDQLGNQYRYMKDYNVTVNISAGGGTVSVGPQLDGTAYSTSEPELHMLSLDIDGQMRVYRWYPGNFSWITTWELESLHPIQCRIGNPCGPFGICTVNDDQVSISCSCLTGYHANSTQDPSQGCVRDIPLPACGVKNESYNVTINEEAGKDYYYNDLTWMSNVTSIDACKLICLNECACLAATYSDPMCYLKGNGTTNYLVNGLTRSSSTNLLMKLAVPYNTGARNQVGNKRLVVVIVAAVAVVLAALVILTTALCFMWRRRSKNTVGAVDAVFKEKKPETDVVPGPLRFTYEEIVQATRNFSHKLGEGDNGVVYKGWMKRKKGFPHGENVVAIKILKTWPASKVADKKTMNVNDSDSEGEQEQFENDVGTLGNIHHINLVRLLGFCISKKGKKTSKMLLVYEYLEKGSLDKYLSTIAAENDDGTQEKQTSCLPWLMRYSIAMGAARGLAYLHHDCIPNILHSGIKPQNILLDSKFAAKVADFGFTRRSHSHATHAQKPQQGYVAPEWRDADQGITSKADVYSFGMVLLELIRGSNSYDHSSLLEWAVQCNSTHCILPNPRVEDKPTVEAMENPGLSKTDQDPDEVRGQKLELLRLALQCVQASPEDRPPMSRVVQVIESVDEERGGYMEDPPNPAMAGRRTGLESDVANMSDSDVANMSYSVISAR